MSKMTGAINSSSAKKKRIVEKYIHYVYKHMMQDVIFLILLLGNDTMSTLIKE